MGWRKGWRNRIRQRPEGYPLQKLLPVGQIRGTGFQSVRQDIHFRLGGERHGPNLEIRADRRERSIRESRAAWTRGASGERTRRRKALQLRGPAAEASACPSSPQGVPRRGFASRGKLQDWRSRSLPRRRSPGFRQGGGRFVRPGRQAGQVVPAGGQGRQLPGSVPQVLQPEIFRPRALTRPRPKARSLPSTSVGRKRLHMPWKRRVGRQGPLRVGRRRLPPRSPLRRSSSPRPRSALSSPPGSRSGVVEKVRPLRRHGRHDALGALFRGAAQEKR